MRFLKKQSKKKNSNKKDIKSNYNSKKDKLDISLPSSYDNEIITIHKPENIFKNFNKGGE